MRLPKAGAEKSWQAFLRLGRRRGDCQEILKKEREGTKTGWQGSRFLGERCGSGQEEPERSERGGGDNANRGGESHKDLNNKDDSRTSC